MDWNELYQPRLSGMFHYVMKRTSLFEYSRSISIGLDSNELYQPRLSGMFHYVIKRTSLFEYSRSISN